MYRIRVSGALGEEWSAWTGGMTIKVIRGVESETTELTGTLPDQAALMGVLERLYSRGARLLSLEHLDS